MTKLTIEDKIAKLQAQLANLETKQALESNPRLKEIEEKLTVKLKTVGDLRKNRARKERVIATAKKRIEEEQERLLEAEKFLSAYEGQYSKVRESYDALAAEKSEIVGHHVDSLDVIMERRDEAKTKASPPKTAKE